MRYEFEFEATPRLGADALKCLLWKRGGAIGPIALVLFPLLLMVLALDPGWRPAAAVLGGAALMLLTLFLLAVWQRRRAARRFFRDASTRVIRVALDDAGVSVTSALGTSQLAWTTVDRVWQCRAVTLLFYQGWQYIAVPTSAMPPGAIDFALSRVRVK